MYRRRYFAVVYYSLLGSMQISIRQRWQIPMAPETLPWSITSDITIVQAGIV
jgi:hypothetical protein